MITKNIFILTSIYQVLFYFILFSNSLIFELKMFALLGNSVISLYLSYYVSTLNYDINDLLKLKNKCDKK
jgi:hypothetical protein